jgi:predicted DNA-binding transcriptional regulator YafY
LRRADRLLQIVQILRRRGAPTTAQAIAEELEVAPRTIYRDVAVLQASRVPIEGEAGVGYVLKAGYDLPPLMFTPEEMEAVALGARMVIERGDSALARAAADVLAKVRNVVPKGMSAQMWRAELLVPHRLEAGVGFREHVPAMRRAIRTNRKLRIDYTDLKDQPSKRTVWPLGLYLYSHVTLLCAWCEVRAGYRAFRSERITECDVLSDTFDPKNGDLMKEFLASFTGR